MLSVLLASLVTACVPESTALSSPDSIPSALSSNRVAVAQRLDGFSPGKIHNAALDRIEGMLADAARRQGRRLTRVEKCDTMFDHVRQSLGESRGDVPRRSLDELPLWVDMTCVPRWRGLSRRGATLLPTSVWSAVTQQGDTTNLLHGVAWHDSLAGDAIGIAAEIALLDSIATLVADAQDTSSSTESFETAMAAIASMGGCEECIEIQVATADLGIESVRYWQQNWEDWGDPPPGDDACPPDPNVPCLPTVGTDNGTEHHVLLTTASAEASAPGWVRVAAFDVGACLGITSDLMNWFEEEMWEERAYKKYLDDADFRAKVNSKVLPGASARSILKTGAKVLRRSLLAVTAYDAAMASAGAYNGR